MDKQALQDELENLEMFVLPDLKQQLIDIQAEVKDSPHDTEDEALCLYDIGFTERRIATIKKRLTPLALDG